LALRARWLPPPKIEAPKSQENKDMNLAAKILSGIFTIVIILLVFVASVFIVSIFLPDNVERAIEIFKNIL
jgi:Na+-driven multidrug efflux pump